MVKTPKNLQRQGETQITTKIHEFRSLYFLSVISNLTLLWVPMVFSLYNHLYYSGKTTNFFGLLLNIINTYLVRELKQALPVQI
jgi:hypothetical protein